MTALVRWLTLMTLAAGLLAGCGSIEQFLPGQQEARHAAEQSHDLQLRVMRFADRYAGRTKDALLDFQGSSEDRLQAQTWKLQQVQAAYSIASGPNPVSNALDMVVLASLSNMVVDDWPVTERYGDRVRPLQEALREMERQAWGLVKGVLTDAQTAQLHDVIVSWRRENPGFRSVAYIRFNDLAKSTGAREEAAEGPGAESSLFSVLGLDPLTELDPAVREIAQSRQLAERSISTIFSTCQTCSTCRRSGLRTNSPPCRKRSLSSRVSTGSRSWGTRRSVWSSHCRKCWTESARRCSRN
jgi:hypothetical protein